MTILLFLFGVAVAAGLFFILADILKLPRLSTEKALLSAGRTEKKRMKSLDALFLGTQRLDTVLGPLLCARRLVCPPLLLLPLLA